MCIFQDAEDFSSFQLKKLIKQSKLTGKIESIRKEMNARTSGDIAYALGDDYYGEVVEARRVVSEEAAHYILIKGLTKRQQIEEANRFSSENRDLVKNENQSNIAKQTFVSKKRKKFKAEEDASETSEENGAEDVQISWGKTLQFSEQECEQVPSGSDDDSSISRRHKKRGSLTIKGSVSCGEDKRKEVLKQKGNACDVKNVALDERESDTDLTDFTETSVPKEIQATDVSTSQHGPYFDNSDLARDVCHNSVETGTICYNEQMDVKELEVERQRLILEEEELVKKREAKIAALMKSLEKRNILSESKSESLNNDGSRKQKKNVLTEERSLFKEQEFKKTFFSVDNFSQEAEIGTTDSDMGSFSKVTGNISQHENISQKKAGGTGNISLYETSSDKKVVKTAGVWEDMPSGEGKAFKKNPKPLKQTDCSVNLSSRKYAVPSMTVDYLEDLGPGEPASAGESLKETLLCKSETPPAASTCSIKTAEESLPENHEIHGDGNSVYRKCKMVEASPSASQSLEEDSEGLYYCCILLPIFFSQQDIQQSFFC